MTIRVLGLTFPLAALAAGLSMALAGQAPRQDPEDEAEAKALGRRAFVENCLICHVEEMTSRLRLTSKQWTAEVDKMIGWGAPVPPEQKAMLTKYLVDSFSEKVPPPSLDLASPEGLLDANRSLAARPSPAGDASKGAPVYAQFCANCHGPSGQGGDLGPRLAGRPVLLEDARYHDVVRQGLRRMPGFVNAIKPEAQADVLAWLRGRTDDAAR